MRSADLAHHNVVRRLKAATKYGAPSKRASLDRALSTGAVSYRRLYEASGSRLSFTEWLATQGVRRDDDR